MEPQRNESIPRFHPKWLVEESVVSIVPGGVVVDVLQQTLLELVAAVAVVLAAAALVAIAFPVRVAPSIVAFVPHVFLALLESLRDECHKCRLPFLFEISM